MFVRIFFLLVLCLFTAGSVQPAFADKHEAPKLSVKIKHKKIHPGEKATLSWKATNSDYCTVEPGVGRVNRAGSIEVSPRESTTYTVTAYGAGKTVVKKVKLKIKNHHPDSKDGDEQDGDDNEGKKEKIKLKVKVDKQVVSPGDAVKLSWKASHAEYCVIDNGIGRVEKKGSIVVTPTQTTTYTITAVNDEESVSAQVMVEVSGPLQTSITFQTDLSTIQAGRTATLFWTSGQADSVSIDQGIGDVPLNGSISVNPVQTTTYTITATGPAGPATAAVTITVNQPLPTVSITATPAAITAGESTTLSWNTANAESVVVDQAIGPVSASGTLSVTPLQTTTYTITATGQGGTSTASVKVTVTQPPPTISLAADRVSIVAGETATLRWTTTNTQSCILDNGIGPVQLNGSQTVSPAATTTYVLTATGPGGTTTSSITITVTQPAPTATLNVTPAAIAAGESATLSWTSSNADRVTIDQGVGAVPASGSVQISPAATTTYTLSATGPGGSVSSQVIITVTARVTPQPEGSFGARYEDLIPPDATKTAYDPKRFALITGEVKDPNNAPVEGVTVSVGANSCVRCHGQEYGTVKTDVDGRFTIPVEGGSTVTVAYQKPGLITSHRQVYVPWNDIAIAETVQMIPLDTAGTVVTFDGNPQTVMSHRSTRVTDVSGSRSATLVFSGDNLAYEVDDSGNVIRELPSITARATEFRTPESMPAALPPTSAYTYCVELSVDGVARVKFSKPVTGWVDNFLGFDVGEIVPVGYYDRDRGVWVPSDNGVVVQLLDTNNDGIVDALDSDGDNLPNDLNGDGSFADEVKGLEDATQYAPGTTFWRFSVTHFTPWDCNWPYGPPQDAISPNPEGDPEVDQQMDEEEDCSTVTNSFVEDRSRIYHEDIAIPGTDMTLHYASNRVEGYKVGKISIPASGATVPSSLKKIIVNANVAGRSFEQILPPLPNQKFEFEWDGLDILGKQLTGSVKINIRIGFVYTLTYYSASGDIFRAFARAGKDYTGIRGRMDFTSWKRTDKYIEIGPRSDELLAEGWSISDQHYYSPQQAGSFFKGNGRVIKVQNRASIITIVAGGGLYGVNRPATEAHLDSPTGVVVDAMGNLYIVASGSNVVKKVDTNGIITDFAGSGPNGYRGDGGPAKFSRLSYPSRVAMDSSGNLYIADTGNHRIRKVDSNGIITTVAGNGSSGFSGDGGPATQAGLNRPVAVAVDSAGNLYIADSRNCRVRKVDTDGTISTVAGTGICGFSGDEGPAVEAELSSFEGIAVDSLGTLFVADTYNLRVRKVDSSGVISTVAGSGAFNYSGDGSRATETGFGYPEDVTVDASGNLYLSSSDFRVLKVDSFGRISTVAGNGTYGFSGNGGPAVEAQMLTIHGIATDAEGNLYTAENGSFSDRIRKVGLHRALIVAGAEGVEYYFAEENGQAHFMSGNGQHQKTIDLNTGTTLRTFSYDINSNLITITDQFGNRTTINRDANGVPTSIVAPDGLTTHLTIDSNNHLAAVTYPDGNVYRFEYTPDGLMTAEIDPNGNRFKHLFTSSGRLTDATDPELGHWKYSKASLSDGSTRVIKTTGEGNVTTYLDRTFSTGAYTSTITGPSSGVSTFIRSADGLTKTSTLSCGMDVISQYDLDPEYKSKYVKQTTETTPAGKQRVVLRNRTYQDTNADKIPDLITETVSLNGKVTTLLQDVPQAKKEVTSSLGRKVTSFYDPATLLTTRMSVAGLADTTYEYDAKGRPTLIRRGSRQTSFFYTGKGFLASVTDPLGRTTTYDHDLMGRVTGIRRPDGSMIGFSYDNNGNMTLLTNPAAVGHGFTYNGNDYKTGYQTPQSGSYRYVYDKDRRLVDTIFPSGQRITNVYDRDRLAGTMTPEGEIAFNYLCATKLGSMTKGGETLSYTYDGKLVTSETASGTLNQALGYTYNNDFKVTGFTYAGGTTSYSYDNDGLLTNSDSFTITRNAGNGLPESVGDGSFSLLRSFNSYGEVDAETTTIGGISKFAYSLSRNLAGQIVAKTENVAGATESYEYSYDDLGRLLTVTKDGTLVEEYRYNVNGAREYEMNTRRGISGRSYAYSSEDHLLSAGNASYQYNLDGFLTTKTQGADVTAYDYSSRGELLSVTLADATTIEYLHDPKGRRIAKKVNGVIVEKYLWQGLTRLLAVYDGADNLVMRFQYADGRMPVAMTKGNVTYYLAYDQVGSLRTVVDASGNMVKQIAYDSFGNILNDSNPTFTVPFGFAGGLHDRDTNLVRFGFRDYDPEVGRWTAKDPIGFEGGDVDLYGYVLGDPVNLVDLLGLRPPSSIPPGVNMQKNIAEANNMSSIDFANAVKSGGKWDYKQQGKQYEDFGNYNYGVTGRATGFDAGTLERAAGAYQVYSGTSNPKWGWPWGDSPYGDDPNDQSWINEGINDFNTGYYDMMKCH